MQELGFRKAFLQPYEKLEFLLTLVIPRRDTKQTAKDLLQRFGTLTAVFHASPHALAETPGIGLKSAHFLRMLGELVQSMSEAALQQRDLMNHPDLVTRFLTHEIAEDESEIFMVLMVDAKNRLIRSERVFRGTIDRSAVFPREIAKLGLAHNARAIICAHNHPSGNPEPSAADLALTQQLMETLATVDILFHDHLIIGREGSVSLRQTHGHLWR
ncbi:MAG: DNA repair protein RadC [Acidobacteria bacterium]|nr:DNA repair protein RadC [Acidobacteriota bacterium]